MLQKELFVVHHESAWAVKRADAERSSALAQTQAEAIARAREIEPGAVIHSAESPWGVPAIDSVRSRIEQLRGAWRNKHSTSLHLRWSK
jgi:hypothetical protein